MTTKSHYALAFYLLKKHADSGSAFINAAFVLGCVEPDVNAATYLKGSLSRQPLRGHNYPNAMPCIEALFKKLQHCERPGILYGYRLGKLIHYLTDAFTYPHNQNFTGTLREHVRYEQEAEKVLEAALSTKKLTPITYEASRLCPVFSSKHEQYLKRQPGAETDMHFILDVIPSIFQSFCLHAAATHRREIKHYENSFNL